VGERVDVVGATPAPTLIYQRREHQIALTEMPTASGPREPRLATRDGYSLLEWTDGERMFVAVSDLPPAELTAFGVAFRRAAATEREEASGRDVASHRPGTNPRRAARGGSSPPSLR